MSRFEVGDEVVLLNTVEQTFGEVVEVHDDESCDVVWEDRVTVYHYLDSELRLTIERPTYAAGGYVKGGTVPSLLDKGYIIPNEQARRFNAKVLGSLARTAKPADDPVNHPSHYTSGPKCECGRTIECITITRERGFAVGNAIKYLWRAGLKGDTNLTDTAKQIQDLEKAVFYIQDEIKRLHAT